MKTTAFAELTRALFPFSGGWLERIAPVALAAAALTSLADYGLFNSDGFRYKQLLAQIGPAQTLVIGLVLGFFLAERLLHYYCDRCLFRFRDEGVRRAVSPLL